MCIIRSIYDLIQFCSIDFKKKHYDIKADNHIESYGPFIDLRSYVSPV